MSRTIWETPCVHGVRFCPSSGCIRRLYLMAVGPTLAPVLCIDCGTVVSYGPRCGHCAQVEIQERRYGMVGMRREGVPV